MKTSYTDYSHRSVADLVHLEDNRYLITRINVPKQWRGQGYASYLLEQMTTDADIHQVTLVLEISPSDGLNFQELEEWYLRHGFKRTEEGYYERQPDNFLERIRQVYDPKH